MAPRKHLPSSLMSFILRTLTRTRPSARELIGPPDPISNIRPIIFKGQLPLPGATTHPYSLAEFGETDEDSIDFQWRLERERLNAFNHAFWLDSNTRFMRGKHDVLDKIQEAGNVTAKDKEAALSAFYCQWTTQESTRQADYTAEWNKRNRAVIRLTMRREFRIWKNLLLDTFIGHPR